MIGRRELGSSGVELSQVTFGSMRLDTSRRVEEDWIELLSEAHARGITTIHSSDEYESFPALCRVLDRMPISWQHVVKLAAPHFGESGFDPTRFTARVESYLERLGSDRIDVVQWMWRGDLDNEGGRLAGLAEAREDIVATFESLQERGLVGAVVTFPYTESFARAVLDLRVGDGLAVYWNPLEFEMASVVERAARDRAGVVALRPFAAGKAFDNGWSARRCLDRVLTTPGVTTAVASVSSRDHLGELDS